MPRSGHDPASYNWPDEYYQVTLRTLQDFAFAQHTFATRPALVARLVRGGYREELEYRGQPFDPAEYDLVEDRWDHQHCAVCRFRLAPGHTYWQNAASMIVCDACHDHIRTLG